MSKQINMKNAEAVDYKIDIAGLGARSHAFSIDWHIRLLLVLAWFVFAGFFLTWDVVGDTFNDLFEDGSDIGFSLLFIVVPTAALYFLYHPVLEVVMQGRTPGKRMAGVRLVTQSGHSPGVAALLVRNVFRLLDSLPALYVVGLVSVALTRQHVRIGDLAAGLVLVYDSSVSKKQIKAATNLALDSTLPAAKQELLLELLERWSSMEINARIRLGEKLLRELDIGFNNSQDQQQELASLKPKKQSKFILFHLQKVAGYS